ncbi:NADPH-flavin oxidoreductase [Clostridium tepidiprofundi DSM 19306]|uniref:NADPH-flavin oxidoreductase n=1 Tax=Clostridium tepidiprofundi DSM 19306 TaxID=1121338 RepID=A0A151AS90_9CLOT|nr:nitroreductase family protein [Clostridium tepidiprofundi]KYH30509.1 NADPH-flavin oxidoreductase [Clostridium tepidiprofundi DSM 19306]
MNKNYSNETIKLLYERASCRSFKNMQIPEDVLYEVIDAGLHAATGGNLQPYAIIKITKDETKKRLVDECNMQNIVAKAPVNLLFCIDWRRIGRWAESCNAPFLATKSYRHFWIAFQDTVICAQNICTAADSVGLGSVYIGTVESCFMELKSILNIPEGVFPVVLLSLGYPTKYPAPSKKLGIEALVHEETYKDLPIEIIKEFHSEKYNHKKYPISESNLSEIREVAKDIGGKEYADEMMKKIQEKGYINMAQRYFGLHYKANWSCIGNKAFIKTLLSYGFTWIEGKDFPNK